MPKGKFSTPAKNYTNRKVKTVSQNCTSDKNNKKPVKKTRTFRIFTFSKDHIGLSHNPSDARALHKLIHPKSGKLQTKLDQEKDNNLSPTLALDAPAPMIDQEFKKQSMEISSPEPSSETEDPGIVLQLPPNLQRDPRNNFLNKITAMANRQENLDSKINQMDDLAESPRLYSPRNQKNNQVMTPVANQGHRRRNITPSSSARKKTIKKRKNNKGESIEVNIETPKTPNNISQLNRSAFFARKPLVKVQPELFVTSPKAKRKLNFSLIPLSNEPSVQTAIPQSDFFEGFDPREKNVINEIFNLDLFSETELKDLVDDSFIFKTLLSDDIFIEKVADWKVYGKTPDWKAVLNSIVDGLRSFHYTTP